MWYLFPFGTYKRQPFLSGVTWEPRRACTGSFCLLAMFHLLLNSRTVFRRASGERIWLRLGFGCNDVQLIVRSSAVTSRVIAGSQDGLGPLGGVIVSALLVDDS